MKKFPLPERTLQPRILSLPCILTLVKNCRRVLYLVGKIDVRLAGGLAAGRAAGRYAFVSGPMWENYYTYTNEIWHRFGPYALVVPLGGHIAFVCIVFS